MLTTVGLICTTYQKLSDTSFPVVSLSTWGLSPWTGAPAEVQSDGVPGPSSSMCVEASPAQQAIIECQLAVQSFTSILPPPTWA